MPSINAGELENCLLRKLDAVTRQGRHRKFDIFDDQGRLVASTLLSHGWRGNTAISASMVSEIKSQLHLARASDLVDLVACTLSREDYLRRFL